MTRRRPYHRAHPVLAAAAVVVLVVFVVLPLATHLAGVLVLLAATGYGGYLLGQRSRPVAKATVSKPDPQAARLQRDLDAARGELAGAKAAARQLLHDAAADCARLRGEVDQARASAEAAWDAAAERPPRRPAGDTQPLDVLDAEQLAAAPMSGARRIGAQP